MAPVCVNCKHCIQPEEPLPGNIGHRCGTQPEINHVTGESEYALCAVRNALGDCRYYDDGTQKRRSFWRSFWEVFCRGVR